MASCFMVTFLCSAILASYREFEKFEKCFPAMTCDNFLLSKLRQKHTLWTVFMFSKLLVFTVMIALIYTKDFMLFT